MTNPATSPDPLSAVRDAVRDNIRGSGRARRQDVEICMDISSRHVGVALWASGLEQRWRANEAAGEPPLLELDHPLLITATPTLVFGSAVTALDHCVAAAAFYEAPGPADGCKDKWGNWYATGDLYKGTGVKKKKTPFQAPPWFDAWVAALIADPAWELTKPFRNRQLHQIQPRSLTIVASTPISSVEQFGAAITPGCIDVQRHYDEVSTFTLRQWTNFWHQF